MEHNLLRVDVAEVKYVINHTTTVYFKDELQVQCFLYAMTEISSITIHRSLLFNLNRLK
jgi:hypothetical protein